MDGRIDKWSKNLQVPGRRDLPAVLYNVEKQREKCNDGSNKRRKWIYQQTRDYERTKRIGY